MGTNPMADVLIKRRTLNTEKAPRNPSTVTLNSESLAIKMPVSSFSSHGHRTWKVAVCLACSTFYPPDHFSILYSFSYTSIIALDHMPSTVSSLGGLSTAPSDAPLIYGRLCTWLAFASNAKCAHCNLQLFQESRGRPFTAQVSQVFGLFSSDDLALCSSSVTPSHGHARPFSNYSSSQLSLSRMPLSNHYLLCSRSFSPMALTRQFLGENFTR